MKRLALFTVIVFLFIFALSSIVFAANRALLVAIDDYPGEVNDLHGCINDLNYMKDILVNKIGLPSSSIKTLTNSSATKSNILNAIDSWLVNGTEPGDTVLFFYSGHGYYVKDTNGDESDGTDETICVYDDMVIDDEIGRKIEKLKGRNVVVFFDSCHSGTAIREIEGIYPKIYKPGKEISLKSYLKTNDTIIDKNISAYTVFLSASAPDETASEIRVDGTAHGAFTYSVYKGIAGLGSNVTFKSLKSFISDYIHNNLGGEQNPKLEGSDSLASRGFKDVFYTKPEEEIEEFESDTGSQPFSVKLWITEQGKTTFNVGEKLEFNVKSSSDGYLYLFDIQDGEEVVLLYPNKYSEGNKIREGKTVTIPDTGTFEIEALQTGRDVVLAIVTTKPYDDAESLIKPSFDDFKILSEGEKRSTVGMLRDLRALGVKPTGTDPGFEWSHDKLEIRVVK